jgi:fluoride ion exporter CrcB/FEX
VNYLFVLLGGGAGALLRYITTEFVKSTVNIKQAFMNILLNNILCLFFVLLGMWIKKIIIE